MSKKKESQKKESSLKSMDDVLIFVIGPNVWGRGKTVEEARRNAGKPKKYVVYLAHKNSYVDPVSGGICYPVDYPPRFLTTKGIPKKDLVDKG